MHKIREILRLHHEAHLSQHQIAASLRLSVGVVNKYLQRAQQAHLKWPLPAILDDQGLKQKLKGTKPVVPLRYAEPDYPLIHLELKRKGVTLQLLWQEYQAKADGPVYSYAQYCALYRQWRERQRLALRQVHKAGDKLFLDYAGSTLDILDPDTERVRPAYLFVAVLGASNYTYVEATWDQSLPNWIASQVRAFQFFGGVPALLVPDNLKAAVNKACRYEPDINSTYADMAAHYGTAVLPARPYKPKDKAKVEGAVLLVQRWILARLRHQTFIGLAELNAAIAHWLVALNERPFKRLPGCRYSQFLALDRPALRPLPERPYEYAQFKKARVHMDYHVEVEGHYYSVPYALVKETVELRLTATTVECLHKGKRVASHARSCRKGQHTTLAEHMPLAHRQHVGWTPGRFLNWAGRIGPGTQQVVNALLYSQSHPAQSYRACLGLLRLAKGHTGPRLEAACQRALALGALSRRSIQSILEKGLDQQPLPTTHLLYLPRQHENLRGADYYR